MTENPAVEQGFEDIYNAWVDFGVDGFRIDTVKHVNTEFWQDWTPAVAAARRQHRQPDFFMFGEVYDSNAGYLSSFMRNGAQEAVLDFGFQAGAQSYVTGSSAAALSRLFAGDAHLHHADHQRQFAAHLPRQPRHGPDRVLPAQLQRPGGPRRTRAPIDVLLARQSGRLLRRRAGLRRYRRRPGLPAVHVRQPGGLLRQPEPGRRIADGRDRPLRHRLPAVPADRRAERGPGRAPGPGQRRAGRAVRGRRARRLRLRTGRSGREGRVRRHGQQHRIAHLGHLRNADLGCHLQHPLRRWHRVCRCRRGADCHSRAVLGPRAAGRSPGHRPGGRRSLRRHRTDRRCVGHRSDQADRGR